MSMIDPDGDVPGCAASRAKPLIAADELRFFSMYTDNEDELDMLSAEGEHSKAPICSSLAEKSSSPWTPRTDQQELLVTNGGWWPAAEQQDHRKVRQDSDYKESASSPSDTDLNCWLTLDADQKPSQSGRHNGCTGTIANHLTAPPAPRARRVGVTILEPDEELADWLPAEFQAESSNSDDHTDQQVMAAIEAAREKVKLNQITEEEFAAIEQVLLLARITDSCGELLPDANDADLSPASRSGWHPELLVTNGGCRPTAEQQDHRKVLQDSDYKESASSPSDTDLNCWLTLDADQKPSQSGHEKSTQIMIRP